jgi:hypothetical protein
VGANMRSMRTGMSGLVAVLLGGHIATSLAASCDHACLEKIGDDYRQAYIRHEVALAPIAKKVRFSENNVVLKFPDGTWDTVTEEVGPALTFSDPVTGMVGIYTSVMQKDTPGFLVIRLKVDKGKITEIEHIIATKRYVSSPPVVFGDMNLKHDPQMSAILKPAERRSRAELIRLTDGYFNTLQHNDGTIKTTFAPTCHRLENGKEAAAQGCEAGFKTGFYAFNERVRDRDYVLVDEERGIVMARGYIDHKGVMDTIKLTDGTTRPSVFREPHTWALLEAFKVGNGAITSIEADFIGAPYYIPPVWPDSSRWSIH